MTTAQGPGTEVVIIGGGVEGCSIAYHLARSGCRVTLLERYDIAAAASGASAGGVRQQRRDFREFPLAFRAIERWKTLESELEADLQYRRDGHLTTVEHPEDMRELVQSVARQVAAGLDIRIITAEYLPNMAPGISPSVIAGAYSRNDGHANPTLTTRAFASAAERHGTTFKTGTTVRAITATSGRVTGVETDDSPISADVVVLAAGAWSPQLASPLGIELPIVAQGFQAMLTEPAPPTLKLVMASTRRVISLKQIPSGQFLLGGGWPGTFDLGAPRGVTTEESRNGNVAVAVGIYPPVGALRIAETWLGIEAVTTDDVPIIGPVDGFDGLVLATGFSGHGFALAPAVGESVASLIATGVTPGSLSLLTLARFATPVENSGSTPTAG